LQPATIVIAEEFIMQVRDVMSPRPEVLAAEATIRDAALSMRKYESGVMPIQKNDKLIGLLTDRDITIRAVAEGLNPNDKVTEILAPEVLYCFEDDDIGSVLENMREQQVQRLIVLNNPERKDLVGIISVADIADKCDDAESAQAIVECCKHYH
jgi:predicted transcriptional regulator